MSDPIRLDDLIRRLLPDLELPDHLRPADLLDDCVVPPVVVAEKVEALRALVSCGGCDDPLTGRIASSRNVARYFQPRLAQQRHETLWIASLDAKNRVRNVDLVSKGGLTSTVVEPRDVIRPLLLNAACSAILVHNHPSGDPDPSPEDLALTERIAKACALVGIRLVDHVIVGADGYYSFLDTGLLPHG